MPKQQIIILTASIIVLLSVVGGSVFYFKSNFDFTPKNTNQISNSVSSSTNANSNSQVVSSNGVSMTPNQPLSTNSELPKPSEVKTSDNKTITTNQPKAQEQSMAKLEGKFQKINQDLGLFSNTVGQGETIKTEYSKAGKILNGKYAGYDRVVGIYGSNMSGDNSRDIFLTKDYKTYINETTLTNELTYSDSQSWDKSKVTSEIMDTETNHTSTIDIGGGMTLVKKPFQVELKDLTKLKLIKESGNLKFYELNNIQDTPTFDALGSTKSIWVADETGLTLEYTLTFSSKITNYSSAKTKYYQEDKVRQDQTDNYYKIREEENAKEPSCQNQDFDKCDKITIPKIESRFGGKLPSPISRNFDLDVNIRLQDISNPTAKLSKEYSQFVVTPCGSFGDPFYSNTPPANPNQVGTLYGTIPLYTSSNQDYAKAHYKAKYGYLTDAASRQNFESMTESKIPTEQEFLAGNNIIWFKDAFGRWVVSADHISGFGGCGKPVIYLYPTVATDINIKFDVPMQLDVQIPKYSPNTGWMVNAQPNGQLKDLQPNQTNCNQFTNKTKGQEYASESCQNNDYPYIYWAGNTPKQYPKIEYGFVVAADQLESQLRSKLAITGMNTKEINDMIEYWLPQMLSKNKPFYQFSLIQNNELDKLFPMTVSPKPQSSIRVFLDWKALDKQSQISQQQLISYPRTGYTMVEWGGLKQ